MEGRRRLSRGGDWLSELEDRQGGSVPFYSLGNIRFLLGLANVLVDPSQRKIKTIN